MQATKQITVFVILCLITLVQIQRAEAKVYGKYGHTFQVKEEGFLEMIQRKLKNINLEEEQRKMANLAKRRIEEPEPLKGITPASENKEFKFDPTYTLEEDVVLPNGKILYLAGTRINPLEKMDFDRKLYFIDARYEKQTKWLKAELARRLLAGTNQNKANKDIRVILVGGKPLKLSEELSKDIYFDQFGELTSKFNIKHVPATVEQEGNKKVLTIKEIACNY